MNQVLEWLILQLNRLKKDPSQPYRNLNTLKYEFGFDLENGETSGFKGHNDAKLRKNMVQLKSYSVLQIFA